MEEEPETKVSTTETSMTETISTTTLVTEMTQGEEQEIRVVEEHKTTLEISPNFTKPLLPSTEVEEGFTVK